MRRRHAAPAALAVALAVWLIVALRGHGAGDPPAAERGEAAKVTQTEAEPRAAEKRAAVPAGNADADRGPVQAAPHTAPLVAAGLVVDPTGAPFRGARVAVWRAGEWGRGLREQPWLPAIDLDVENGPDGRFTVRGEAGRGELRLSADADGYAATERLRFERGDDDVRIVLGQQGRIAGTVLADTALLRAGLLAGVVAAQGQGKERAEGPRHELTFAIGEDGAFDVAVAPDVYDLAVRVGEIPTPLGLEAARVEGIAVPPGRVAHDARLHAIPLHGVVAVTLELRGADGRLLRDVSAEARVPGRIGTVGTAADGHLVLGLHRDDAVEVHAEGYRRVRLEDPAAHAVVTLEPAIRVRLVLSPPLGKGKIDVNLLDQRDGSTYDAEGGGGGYVAELPRAGRYRLWGAGWLGRSVFDLTGFEPAAITVVDQPGVQTFAFSLSPADRARVER